MGNAQQIPTGNITSGYDRGNSAKNPCWGKGKEMCVQTKRLQKNLRSLICFKNMTERWQVAEATIWHSKTLADTSVTDAEADGRPFSSSNEY